MDRAGKQTTYDSDSDEGESIDFLNSDNSEISDEDGYEITTKDVVISKRPSIKSCPKLDKLKSDKPEIAAKKINSYLEKYDNDSLIHLDASLLIEYYYGGWIISDNVSSRMDSMFDDTRYGWEHDDYEDMISSCKEHLNTLEEEKLRQIASYLLHEAYFGTDSCVYDETYLYINEFLKSM